MVFRGSPDAGEASVAPLLPSGYDDRCMEGLGETGGLPTLARVCAHRSMAMGRCGRCGRGRSAAGRGGRPGLLRTIHGLQEGRVQRPGGRELGRGGVSQWRGRDTGHGRRSRDPRHCRVTCRWRGLRHPVDNFLSLRSAPPGASPARGWTYVLFAIYSIPGASPPFSTPSLQ